MKVFNLKLYSLSKNYLKQNENLLQVLENTEKQLTEFKHNFLISKLIKNIQIIKNEVSVHKDLAQKTLQLKGRVE